MEANIDSVDVEGKKEIVELITSLEDKRQDSLYVGTMLVGGRIKTPRKEISRQMCEDLFRRIEEFLPTIETNLMTTPKRYKNEAAKLARERVNPNLQLAKKKEQGSHYLMTAEGSTTSQRGAKKQAHLVYPKGCMCETEYEPAADYRNERLNALLGSWE
jgi:hypothetical protein